MSKRITLGHRLSRRVIAFLYAPVLLTFGLTIWVNVNHQVPFSFFSRDPIASLNGHPFTGIQSNLGVSVWCAAAAICLFCSRVVSRGDTESSSFLLWSGGLTLWLMLDDLFQLHENVLPRSGLFSETTVFVGYGFLLAWYVIRFFRSILDNDVRLLLVAFTFFGLSVLIDAFQGSWPSPWRVFFEDGFKLLGIVSWSGYLIDASFHAVGASMMGHQR